MNRQPDAAQGGAIEPIAPEVLVELRKRADQRAALLRALMKAKDRRFTGEPLTGFGALS